MNNFFIFAARSDAIRERMWIGLHDTGGEGNFVWQDDTPVCIEKKTHIKSTQQTPILSVTY